MEFGQENGSELTKLDAKAGRLATLTSRIGHSIAISIQVVNMNEAHEGDLYCNNAI